jgi:hypothetical protein
MLGRHNCTITRIDPNGGTGTVISVRGFIAPIRTQQLANAVKDATWMIHAENGVDASNTPTVTGAIKLTPDGMASMGPLTILRVDHWCVPPNCHWEIWV